MTAEHSPRLESYNGQVSGVRMHRYVCSCGWKTAGYRGEFFAREAADRHVKRAA